MYDLYNLYDLYDLGRVAGWEPYYLRDLQQHIFLGSHLYYGK